MRSRHRPGFVASGLTAGRADAARHWRQLHPFVQLVRHRRENGKHVVGLVGHRLDVLDLRGLDVHGSRIESHLSLRVDDEPTEDHVVHAKQLADLYGRRLVDASRRAEVLLVDELLHSIALDDADGAVGRELGDQHVSDTLSQARRSPRGSRPSRCRSSA